MTTQTRPHVGQVYWVGVRGRWRKARVLKVSRVNMTVALLRPIRGSYPRLYPTIPWNCAGWESFMTHRRPARVGAEWQ